MYRILLTLFFWICLSNISSAQIVETTGGFVEGRTLTSRNGRSFSAFLGIPYGKPPVGKLRFQAPEPSEPWSGILDATEYGEVCPQLPDYIIPINTNQTNTTGSEDCLSINIFSNKDFSTDNLIENYGEEVELLPVLVFIHGGYFMALSGSKFGPKYLMDHDVVFVTFNYRLGALGFLSTQDEAAPGNAGIKDQVLALKWIQENIISFGGDPNRVTIYGESAGGAAVQYHLLSESSRGLFSAAISGSGTAFKIYSHQVAPLNAAQVLANEVGCGEFTDNTTELVDCLQSVNASDIAALTNEYFEIVKDPLRIFCPSTENESYSTDPFITKDPYQILRDGQQQRVPWMVGINSGEGFILSTNILDNPEWIPKIDSDWLDNLSPKLLLFDEQNSNWTDIISEFYLESFRANGTVNFRQDLMGFTDMFTDRYYVHASITAAKIQSQFSDTFVYYNDYMTTGNDLGLGTTHGEEMALLFSPPNLDGEVGIDIGHVDYEQSKLMVDLFVQFITNPHNVTFAGQVWGPLRSSDQDMKSFIFKNSNRGYQGVSILPRTIANRVNFWENNNIPPYEQV